MVNKESQVSETSCFYGGTHRLNSKYLSSLMSKSEEKFRTEFVTEILITQCFIFNNNILSNCSETYLHCQQIRNV